MKGQRTKADSLEAFRVPERSEPASGRHPAPDQTPRCLHEKHSRPCVFRALGSWSDAVVRWSEANVPGEPRSEGGGTSCGFFLNRGEKGLGGTD